LLDDSDFGLGVLVEEDEEESEATETDALSSEAETPVREPTHSKVSQDEPLELGSSHYSHVE
jgi:hypothetical protein